VKKSSVSGNKKGNIIMIETIASSGEFERKPHREVETKYLPLFPESLDQFRPHATPIEQLYLSHPNEAFSLRLRETLQNGELVYSAALKDNGRSTDNGLDRMEVETPISANTYAYYKQMELPSLKKLRAEPFKNIVIDWFEDGHVHTESEHPISWAAFLEQQGFSNKDFVDITSDSYADNEWRAHIAYRKQHEGHEAFSPEPDLDVGEIARTLWSSSMRKYQTIATIAGRSGSGKTTLINEVQARLRERGASSVILSTDDYHRGKTWLEQYKGGPWTDWDAPIVYDLEALKRDLEVLREGKSVVKRQFDFHTEEPVPTGFIDPAPIILIEGIYARDPSLNEITDIRYELPTPLATCIGRRLLRDLCERPQFAEPGKSLRYILEQAEPAYRNQA
jgi:uridine kinase